jgi:hypothetical protein
MAHGYRHNAYVAISGANESGYNGSFLITYVDANTFTYVPDTAPTVFTATGTLSSKVAPAGFTKPYSGTQLAVYRQPVGTSCGFYLDVDDNQVQDAHVRAYEVMTGLGAGTAPFPTVAQVSSGGIYKSNTLLTTKARPWICITNGKSFYFWNNPNETAGLGTPRGSLFFFGDYDSYVPGDTSNCAIRRPYGIGDNSGTSMLQTGLGNYGAYHARAANGSVQSVITCSLNPEQAALYHPYGYAYGNLNRLTYYPEPVTGKLFLSSVPVSEMLVSYGSRITLHGKYPGFYISHSDLTGFATGSIISGTGDLAGREFMTFFLGDTQDSVSIGENIIIFLVEVSQTW